MSKENPYLNKVYNLSKKVSEWKQIAFYQGVIIFMLLIFMMYQASSAPVRLIPQMSPEKSFLTEKGSQNNEYLRIISEADLSTYTTWSPDNVKKQFDKLIPRIAPGSYGPLRMELKVKAEINADEKVSQTYMVSSSRVFDRNVVFSGHLKRWVGSDSVFDGEVFFVVKYLTVGGIPMVLSVDEFKEYEQAVGFAKKD